MKFEQKGNKRNSKNRLTPGAFGNSKSERQRVPEEVPVKPKAVVSKEIKVTKFDITRLKSSKYTPSRIRPLAKVKIDTQP